MAQYKFPKDLHIVFDLDQTLVATQDYADLIKIGGTDSKIIRGMNNRNLYFNLSNLYNGVSVKTSYWTIIRPHTKEFLDYCSNNCKSISIWSAGEYTYVHTIVNKLFSDYDVNVIFTRDDQGDDLPIKDLKKMYTYTNGEMNERNTLIIDDNPLTFPLNPDNVVFIPPYNPKPKYQASLTKDDTALITIQEWLSGIKNYGDIRKVPKPSFRK